jgi:hypothetical protein
MRLQRSPSAVTSRQLFLGESGMDFSVADAVNSMRLAATLAFGQQVMFVNVFTCYERSAA